VSLEQTTKDQFSITQFSKKKNIKRFKIIVAILTVFGLVLFSYLIHSVGLASILEGIARIGFSGFLILQIIYFLRIVARSIAWNLSVYEPYELKTRYTIPAVIIGEAMSNLIPLGILISGTSKAVAVRHRVPLVVGLSSIATENLFYSVVTGIFICFGSYAFLQNFELSDSWVFTINMLIAVIILLILFIVFIVLKQWHFASQFCEFLYNRKIGTRILESGRLQVRLFENLIYGFYRKHPNRFLPIFLCQAAYHFLGIFEAWFILSRIREVFPSLQTAFLLESISRAITIFFKFVPFVIGIDEAGAQFVTETLALGAGVGVTIAIIRKGRVIFWTAIGLIFITKRGLSIKEFTEPNS
jgi:glycosyltransferase 2 family protein